MRKHKTTWSAFESLESRKLLAYVATLGGTQASFFSGANDTLVITRNAGGQLSHNRFAEGDTGYSSAFDFNSLIPGIQTLSSSASTVITIQDSDGNAGFQINDAARTIGGSYWVYNDSATLPDGTEFVFGDALDRFKLDCSNHADDVNLRSTDAKWTTYFQVNANAGDDNVDFGPTGTMDDLIARSTVLGGAGTDTLVFHDEIDSTTGTTYACESSYLQRTGIPDIQYDGIEGLHLHTTEQADVVQFGAGGEGVDLLIDANGGADSIRIDSINLPAYNSFVVDAGSGADSVIVTKTGSNHFVQLNCGSGNDIVDVQAVSGQPCEVRLATSDTLASLKVQTQAKLVLPSAAGSSLVVNSPPLLQGYVDLCDAAMIIRGSANQADVQSAIGRGFDGNSWNGSSTGGTYSSLIGSSAAADGVGFCTAAQAGVANFVGVAVNGNDTLLQRTMLGDTNLDHKVDFADLLQLAQHYGQMGRLWNDGNFNFDSLGKVDFSDLLILAQNYAQTLLASTNLAANRVVDEVL